MALSSPSIIHVDAFADAVVDTLHHSEIQSPFTLILGAGFSYPIIPCARDIIPRVPEWLKREPVEFWKRLNSRLGSDGVHLNPKQLPDLSTGDLVGHAYDVAMLHGLKSPGLRRSFYRSLCDQNKGHINLAHLYLASILYAQDIPSTWKFKNRFSHTIFTTNFDPLLQNALQLMSKLYYMTDRPHTLDIPHDEMHDAIHLIYTHGSVHQALLANTHEEIKSFSDQQAGRLPEFFKRHGVIVVGYSGWNDSCMTALEKCNQFDHNLYWCDRHDSTQIDKLLSKNVYDFLCTHRQNACYVQIDSADSVMQRLHQSLQLGLAPSVVENPLPALLERLRCIRS